MINVFLIPLFFRGIILLFHAQRGKEMHGYYRSAILRAITLSAAGYIFLTAMSMIERGCSASRSMLLILLSFGLTLLYFCDLQLYNKRRKQWLRRRNKSEATPLNVWKAWN